MRLLYGWPFCFEYGIRGYIFRFAQTLARGATGYAPFAEVQPLNYARLRVCTRQLQPLFAPDPILLSDAIVVILQLAVCRPLSVRVCLLYDQLDNVSTNTCKI